MFKTAVFAATAALVNAWGEQASHGYGSKSYGYGTVQKQTNNYSFSMPVYRPGHVTAKRRHVGPYQFRRPRIDYRVRKPAPRLNVDGPDAQLGLAKPVFGAVTRAGDIRSRVAHVANRYQRPQIANRRPQFAYKQPQMAFNSGYGATRGAQFGYRAPKVQQEYVAPRQQLRYPDFAAKAVRPTTGFDIAGPMSRNSVAAPQAAMRQTAPVAHYNPKIRVFDYNRARIDYHPKRVQSKPEYYPQPVHVKVQASPMKSHGW